MSNRHFAVCGAVFIGNRVMLVRHTYGTAKDRILLPGGYVKENELATDAVIREIFEETTVKTKVNSIISVQFKPEQWCVVFLMDYIDGTPVSDGYENSEVLLLTLDEALGRSDLTNMSRAILTSLYKEGCSKLAPGSYNSVSLAPGSYKIFGV